MDDDLGQTLQFSIGRLFGVVAIAAVFLAVLRLEDFRESATLLVAAAAALGAAFGLLTHGAKGALVGSLACAAIVVAPMGLFWLLIGLLLVG